MLSWISFLKTRTKPVYLINPPCVKLNRMTINIRLEIQSICGQNCWFQIKSPSGLNLISLQNNGSRKTEKEKNEITILSTESNCQRWSIFYFTTFCLFAAGSKRWAWWGVNRNQGLLDRGEGRCGLFWLLWLPRNFNPGKIFSPSTLYSGKGRRQLVMSKIFRNSQKIFCR